MAFFKFPPPAGSTLPTGAATAANQVLEIAALDSIDSKTIKSDTDNVTVVSSVLPTGAATETTLSAINTKTPSQGQAAMAASVPVAIASDQSALSVSVSSSALPTGAATETTLAAMSAKLPATLGQKASTASLAVVIANDQSNVAVDAFQGGSWTVSATQGGSWSVGRTWTLASGTDSVAAVQSGVWSVASSQSGTWNVNAVQSGTWNINNISGTISLPTGAATETTLSSINTKLPSQGQAAMAASVPVVIASNQSNIGVLTKNSLVGVVYDAIGVNVSGGTTDVYTYYTGGLAGTLVRTVTLTYTDSSKSTLQSVVGT